jgi:hypothetical protein
VHHTFAMGSRIGLCADVRGAPLGGQRPACQKEGLRRRHLDREISWGGNDYIGGKHVATFVASFANFYEPIKLQVAKKKDVINQATLTGFEPVLPP